MELGTMDSASVVKVDHKTGRFIGGPMPTPRLSGRVVGLRYGRRKFDSRDGTWRPVCASPDAITGTMADGEQLPCVSAPFCEGCKPNLLVAMMTPTGPFIVETSASVALAISNRLWPYISRGLAVSSMRVTLTLGLTQSSRMSFAQCSVDVSDSPNRYQLSGPAAMNLLADLDAHAERTFTVRPAKNSRPDLGAAELVV